ncbi:glycine-rich domain-containing protein [Phytohabitans aurantiacus]|uniref:Uncharacterized protein n=1 Tax=Phytohabitans aurantiacus TaxID=3016789 RepID=A0ABQ5R4W3_9ACTN|nr:hypothetical protein [Phytohabitans aurantiacus]GLI01824.1 hypothetical protein Pa4123_71010 [Phytohabitans aurantiacus]
MIWKRLTKIRSARRVAVVDDLQFSAGGRQRLTNKHHNLSGDDIRLVEGATRQWFRIVARHPRATLSMPSLVVADLWSELALDAREYAAFCDAAFGRRLTPASRQTTAAGTLATLRYGRQDENCGPTALPLLFRVDHSLAIQDGLSYLADCGGRGECFQVRGMICLQHIGGPGKRLRVGGIRGDLPFHDSRYGYAGGADVSGFGDGGGT